MRFTETAVAGAFLIDIDRREDERGFFARMWSDDEFAARGLSTRFVQCNDSFCARRGTLRGLHYQTAPHEEIKLIRCVRGAIFDVVADVRSGSPTYRQWVGQELTADNRRMMYVPAGCAHGYLALEDASEAIYTASSAHDPRAERGVRWDDPTFHVRWPDVGALTVSDKDRRWPDFQS